MCTGAVPVGHPTYTKAIHFRHYYTEVTLYKYHIEHYGIVQNTPEHSRKHKTNRARRRRTSG